MSGWKDDSLNKEYVLKNKYVFVTVLLAVILLAGVGFTAAYLHRQDGEQSRERLTVVTSFYHGIDRKSVV